MIDIIRDLFQESQVRKQRLDNLDVDQKSRNRTSDLKNELRELEQKHEQLKLVTLAFWSLLRDHTGLMESDLKKYVDNIDLMDGKKDGKKALSKEKSNCSSCKRIILSSALVCVYCGTQNATNTGPFDRA